MIIPPKNICYRTKLFSVVALSVIVGCAMSAGRVVPIGKDTFMIGKQGSFTTFSGYEVKADLYSEANEFCACQNKQFMPISSASRDSGYAQYANAEIQFRCLKEGDPELGRPTMESIPDIRIEIK